MAIPNSHTRIFTTIPISIRKSWSVAPITARDGRAIDHRGLKHAHSLIDSIKIEVEFNRAIQDGLNTLTEFDESETDAISAWQEARRGWATVEKAIADVVDTMIKANADRAARDGMQTVDVLRIQRTDAEKSAACPSSPDEFPRAQRKVSSDNDEPSSTSTISPHESASVVTLTRSTLEEMMDKLSANRKVKSKVKPSPTFLNYVAGARRKQ